MAMNISCKFEKASYNIFFVRAVTVKSLYTLQRRRNEVKSDAIRWIQIKDKHISVYTVQNSNV